MGRELAVDYVYPNYNTKLINTNGGNQFESDIIFIYERLFYFYNLTMLIYPFTNLINEAFNGTFNYFISNFNKYNGKTFNQIQIKSNTNLTEHFIQFNYSIFELENIELIKPISKTKAKPLPKTDLKTDLKTVSETDLKIKTNKEIISKINLDQEKNSDTDPKVLKNEKTNLKTGYNWDKNDPLEIIFKFKSQQEIKIITTVGQNIIYQFNDNLQMFIIKNNTKYINHITRNKVNITAYSKLASKLNTSIFIDSLKNNNTYSIGYGNISFLQNNPERKSHLIGNSKENIISIKRLNKTKTVYIYNLDQKLNNLIDLRVFNDSVIFLNISENNNGLEILIFKNKKQINKIYLIDSIKNRWYSNIIIYLLNRPIRIERNTDQRYVIIVLNFA